MVQQSENKKKVTHGTLYNFLKNYTNILHY